MTTADTSARVLRALDAATAKLEAAERSASEPVAIVGIGCRFPGGVHDPESFWQLLVDGVDAVGQIPADRWNVAEHFDPNPDSPGCAYVRHGAFLDDVDRFDAEFFGISPREAESLDPQQRILLETAWEAFERAGFTRARLRDSRTGVFVGITNCDYGRLIARTPDHLDSYYITGNTLNAAAGRIAYLLGLRGPALAIDTACSSSLVALHLAAQSLRAGECDAALAAGVNLILAPEGLIALSKARVLSPDGRCKAFDAAANGMGRGEGCGVLVLKRLSDAERDSDDVWALIRGSAVNQDGASSGLTVPSGPAQEDVIRRALAAARVEPREVDYVEAHGTGTSLGDPIELGALGAVFGAGRAPDRPLLVGAVKANLAHAESAAGLAGIIKIALSMRHRAIPPQLHFHAPTPHVDWDNLPLSVPTRLTTWPNGGKRLLAGISGFGFSGTNAHVVLEGPLPSPRRDTEPSTSPETLELVLLSAHNEPALRAVARNYAALLKQEPGLQLADLCFSAATMRDHHAERLALVAASRETAAHALQDWSSRAHVPRLVRGRVQAGHFPGIAFLLSGQGAQYAGMGRELYHLEPVFRAEFDHCSEILRPLLGAWLPDLIYGPDEGLLDDTAVTQPALFTLELALARLWRTWGVEPAALTGHSVGEFAAACLAGVFSPEDALALVVERGRLMSALESDGVMVAVLAPEDRLVELVKSYPGRVAISAINAPSNLVLSGERAAIHEAIGRLAGEGIICNPLAVSQAFHSPLMNPVLEPFRAAVARVNLRPPQVPFVSTLTGARADEAVTTPEYWVRQVIEPVRYAAAVTALRGLGMRTLLEVGPHNTLAALAKGMNSPGEGSVTASLKRGASDREQMLLAMGELYADGAVPGVGDFYRDRSVRRVGLPTYPYQRKRYWYRDTALDTAPAAPELWEVDWRDERRRTGGRAPARWLLLMEHSGLSAELALRLAERGDTVDVLPRAQASDLAGRIAAGIRDPNPLRILHLWTLTLQTADHPINTPEPIDDAGWARMLELGCLSALEAVQAAANAGSRGARIWFITRGAQAIGASGADVAQAPVWGLGRVLASEHPDLFGGLIDLDPDGAVDPAAVLDEIAAGQEDLQVAYRAGRRLVPRLRRSGTPSASYRFAAHAAYVITGGLGGLGLAVAEWMVEAGARTIILAARHEPPSHTRDRIRKLTAAGADIRVVLADVAQSSGAARIVGEAESLAPLRGIVHAAGTLDDAVLLHQSRERFSSVMAGKARGALNLDALTRGRDLDFFVMFSSIASLLGSPGQGNYAAANAVLDALAARRRSRGAAGLSVAWGPWADVGMGARLGGTERGAMEARGLTAFTAGDALRHLAHLLTCAPPFAAVMAFDPGKLARMARPMMPMLGDFALSRSTVVPSRAANRAALTNREAVEAYVLGGLRTVLHLGSQEGVPTGVSLQQQGLDSMMATELRNGIAHELGVDLSIASFLGGSTVDRLVDDLHRQLGLARVASGADGLAGSEQLEDFEEVIL